MALWINHVSESFLRSPFRPSHHRNKREEGGVGSEEEDLKLRGFQARVNLHALDAIAQSICERERERERTHHSHNQKQRKEKKGKDVFMENA